MKEYTLQEAIDLLWTAESRNITKICRKPIEGFEFDPEPVNVEDFKLDIDMSKEGWSNILNAAINDGE